MQKNATQNVRTIEKSLVAGEPGSRLAKIGRKQSVLVQLYEALDGEQYVTHQGAAFRNTMIKKAQEISQRFRKGEINFLNLYRNSTRKYRDLESLAEQDLIKLHHIKEFTTIAIPRGEFVMNYRVKGVNFEGDILLGGISGPTTERSTHKMQLAEFMQFVRKKEFGDAVRASLIKLLAAA